MVPLIGVFVDGRDNMTEIEVFLDRIIFCQYKLNIEENRGILTINRIVRR